MKATTTPFERFRELFARADDEIDLAEAALLIAAEDDPDLDVGGYRARLREMGATLRHRLRPDISVADTIVALNHYLFAELGFAGDTQDYYDPRNSFLNAVLDRKRGIPITLSIVYLDVGRAAGLNLHGVSFPGHFLVKCLLRDGMVILDPYAKGVSLGIAELQQRLRVLQGGVAPPQSAMAALLCTASTREIVVRMLHNLKGIYSHRQEWARALAAVDRIIAAAPGLAEEYRDRGRFYLHLECFRAALADFEAYLHLQPDAGDAGEIKRQIVELEVTAARLN